MFENLIGKPRFKIAKLGYVSDFIQNPPGMYVTLAAGTVLIILVFLPDFINKKNNGAATTNEEETPTEETN